jgi:anti-sigma regulatory factor (Ser/Thr protein kinase)
MGNAARPATQGLRHAALLYRTQADFTAAVLDFIAAGLRAREHVLVAATGPNLCRLQARLDHHDDFLTWADMSSYGSNPRRVTSAVRLFAEQHRGQPIRCVQEPAWRARPVGEICEAIRHEALVNLVLAGSRAAVLCAYDRQLDAGTITGAERTHPVLIRDGTEQASASYAADRLIPAECDGPLSSPPPAAVALTYRHNQAAARSFAANYARLAGLSPDRTGDLVIAVGELAGNTLTHTGGPGALTMWVADDEIVCQVQDSGQITDPLAGTRRPDADDPSRGRGLWVVDQLCDLVEMRTGAAGTTIRLHMHLPVISPAGSARHAVEGSDGRTY